MIKPMIEKPFVPEELDVLPKLKQNTDNMASVQIVGGQENNNGIEEVTIIFNIRTPRYMTT